MGRKLTRKDYIALLRKNAKKKRYIGSGLGDLQRIITGKARQFKTLPLLNVLANSKAKRRFYVIKEHE